MQNDIFQESYIFCLNNNKLKCSCCIPNICFNLFIYSKSLFPQLQLVWFRRGCSFRSLFTFRFQIRVWFRSRVRVRFRFRYCLFVFDVDAVRLRFRFRCRFRFRLSVRFRCRFRCCLHVLFRFHDWFQLYFGFRDRVRFGFLSESLPRSVSFSTLFSFQMSMLFSCSSVRSIEMLIFNAVWFPISISLSLYMYIYIYI